MLEEKYLSAKEVCEIIPGMTTALLAQMRFRGDSIPYIRVSPKKIVYRLSAVSDFMLANEQTSTRENISA